MLVMLANKHTKNAFLLCDHSHHTARGVPAEDTLVVDNDESISELEWTPQLQAGRREGFWRISPVPSRINFFNPHPVVTSLCNRREVIFWLMKEGDGERTFNLGPNVTMSFHPFDSNFNISSYFSSRNHTYYFSLPIEQNPPNPPQKGTLIPRMPCKKTLQQLTPGLSGTQWVEDLFRGKQQAIPFLILTFDSSELTIPPFVEPSQYNEPPIPGLGPSSERHEAISACDPEPEVAPMQ
ncbi:hypothetical protein O181_089954 [Austropuccinia psidii MF-1]|uniref:Uncharacterized protein n=1 Tax=Austropuccinia psidii MF-1 TaxID=1389203 RepID=A0A9Q3IUM9_9BASI|nr:hypothetical protein [Austropuccinia psidii MF-1]